MNDNQFELFGRILSDVKSRDEQCSDVVDEKVYGDDCDHKDIQDDNGTEFCVDCGLMFDAVFKKGGARGISHYAYLQPAPKSSKPKDGVRYSQHVHRELQVNHEHHELLVNHEHHELQELQKIRENENI